MYISLQKSSIFSVVRSCSRNTLMATSVPFHIPRKTSPKNPDQTSQWKVSSVGYNQNPKVPNEKRNKNCVISTCKHKNAIWNNSEQCKHSEGHGEMRAHYNSSSKHAVQHSEEHKLSNPRIWELHLVSIYANKGTIDFFMPEEVQDYLPIPTRVPIVISEKSMFHSSKGNNGLLRNGELWNTLFHANAIFSLLIKSSLFSVTWPLYSCGEEGNDMAFWVEPVRFLEPLSVAPTLRDASS